MRLSVPNTCRDFCFAGMPIQVERAGDPDQPESVTRLCRRECHAANAIGPKQGKRRLRAACPSCGSVDAWGPGGPLYDDVVGNSPYCVGDSAGDQKAERLAIVLLLPPFLARGAHPVTGPGAVKAEEVPVLAISDGVGTGLGAPGGRA